MILVDADPKGTLTRDLAATPHRDLAATLRDGTPLADALVTLSSGLKVLPRAEGLPRGLAARLPDLLLGSGADLVVVDLGLVGSDVTTERLIADERLPALLLAASARRSRFSAIDRAMRGLGTNRRLRLVVTDAQPGE